MYVEKEHISFRSKDTVVFVGCSFVREREKNRMLERAQKVRSCDKIMSLQTIRALAFLAIFSSHCEITRLGTFGVSVFLILSGFVMRYTYNEKALDLSLKGCFWFSIKKVSKLYPLHLIMMCLAGAVTIKSLFDDFSIEKIRLCICQFFLNVTLLQAWVPMEKIYFSLNGVAWYLSVCLFLYMIFPIVLKKMKKIHSCRQALIIAVVIYFLQIIIGKCSQSLSALLIFPREFTNWVTYIFPMFRLGDFVIVCC